MIISETMWGRLKTVLTYTSIESLVYQAALFAHQYILYRYIGAQLYGYFGTIFSIIYLASLYLNMGLDLTMAQLFGQGRNGYLFLRNTLLQALCNGIFGVIVLCVIATMFQSYSGLTFIQLLICGLIIISETSKKTAKNLLHLLFLHRFVAITELICLSTYIIIIWTLLLFGHEASFFVVLIPLLVTSLAGLTVYLCRILPWWKSLPIEQGNQPFKKIITLRAQNYLYQITHSLYSPNFLIPIIAMQHSMELASLLKIMSMGIYAINSIIQHIFGITSTVLFSHIKQYETKDKQVLLQTLQRYIIKIATAVTTCSILHYYLLCNTDHTEHFYPVYLFLLIICSEHLALAYEHFFIIEERTTVLSICNISLWLFIMIVKKVMYASVVTLLLTLIISRAIHFFIIYLYGHYYWNFSIAGSRKPFYTKPVL